MRDQYKLFVTEWGNNKVGRRLPRTSIDGVKQSLQEFRSPEKIGNLFWDARDTQENRQMIVEENINLAPRADNTEMIVGSGLGKSIRRSRGMNSERKFAGNFGSSSGKRRTSKIEPSRMERSPQVFAEWPRCLEYTLLKKSMLRCHPL